MSGFLASVFGSRTSHASANSIASINSSGFGPTSQNSGGVYNSGDGFVLGQGGYVREPLLRWQRPTQHSPPSHRCNTPAILIFGAGAMRFLYAPFANL